MKTKNQAPGHASRGLWKRLAERLQTKTRDRLNAKYANEAPPPPGGLGVPEVFRYLHYKAFLYLELGPAQYRQGDFFGLPPENWALPRLETLKSGCEQIVAWRGVSRDCPLEGIGVEGFYTLLTLFHFKLKAQAAFEGGPGMIIDKMQMEHVVDSRTITLYNKVRSIGLHGNN